MTTGISDRHYFWVREKDTGELNVAVRFTVALRQPEVRWEILLDDYFHDSFTAAEFDEYLEIVSEIPFPANNP